MVHHENVEFKTLDGLTLRGWLYPTDKKGPGIVMTPGFNCVKEMFIPEVAEGFQKAGITALIYDPRSTGESDGIPRNEIDPGKQVDDYSDALTFLAAQPTVDTNRMAFWGQSFSATVALCSAALDKRPKLVIAICPLLNFELSNDKFSNVLLKTIKDRESQLKGNKPFYLPVLTERGENPAGFGIGADKEGFEYIVDAKERVAANHKNQTTLQTYRKLVSWQPHKLMEYITPTPVMFVVPELDRISPPEDQLFLFDTLTSPKRKHLAAGKGHLNVLSGEDAPVLMQMQVDFVLAALEGKL
ncbi:DltD domain-containing protein [Phlyctema vagabunda]|uniref:DltD domain-containing protein n=1 Tax=Phlyctema vagabunda TaxID=108571 RepID=A0ABR4PRD9_9HELO